MQGTEKCDSKPKGEKKSIQTDLKISQVLAFAEKHFRARIIKTSKDIYKRNIENMFIMKKCDISMYKQELEKWKQNCTVYLTNKISS